ncbi:MAG: hypothetical protein IKB08_08260 [Clostridia bacterium]|nr:hypothetical protein [Clostridia bacterium]
MIIFIILSSFCFLSGLWGIILAAASRFPRFRGETVGTLMRADTRRNVPRKHGTIPIETDYIYTYTVNGKKYRYKGYMYHGKRSVFKKVPIVYITFCPRCAYPYEFRGDRELILGIAMLLMSGMFIFFLLYD